ncbi:endonuclease domain-containing protein [Photobacterium sp. 1_MG-2023]|uniref:endonuclease domain-containing protein n=1 Tax=Photobacterium sp. 1_MG-2023 TaxID=3062646 RepID=UPI0026E336C7|nr:endonuclease domain-containing protein [Photobacterium sp. 1_MG-2023]MDO6708579.1 endonuclease domain-containing protein [Photobacterium sp. 1_MG-2023]
MSVLNATENKSFRSQLRTYLTEPERRLWRKLRCHQLGVKFRRQHGIGRYIVDFYCPDKKLVIEIDGDSHYSEVGLQYDEKRDALMAELGIRVLRFTNQEVMRNLDEVVEMIYRLIHR